MTHNDIYTKFLIEYDKANVTSSYPALTEYEIATLLDRAYLLLIARKLTGNNTRRAPFEYDTKAVEDLRPLIKTQQLQFRSVGTVANELLYSLPTDMLYYLLGVAEFAKGNYGKELLTTVDHKIADNFKATNSNIPWIKKPVAYLESNEVHMLFDPYKHTDRTGSLVGTWHTQELSREYSSFIAPKLIATYIVTPAKFAIGVPPEEEENASNNNGGNNNGGQHSGNSDVADNTAWVIEENFPESMDNATNSIFFYAYALKDTYKVSCNIEITSGGSILEIQKTTVDGYGNYGYVASGNASGIARVKISCSSDPSIFITKQIDITYNTITPKNDPTEQNPNPSPETNGDIQFIDLGLPSGTKWADRNFGADTIASYGGYYGWGDPTGEKINQTDQYGEMELSRRGIYPPVDISQTNTDLDIVRQTLGGNCHTPNTEQLLELVEHCRWKLQMNYMNSGVNGWIVTGPNNNEIFIPMGGCRSGVDNNGNVMHSQDTNASYYWSSELSDGQNTYMFGKFAKFSGISTLIYSAHTFYGMHIRPVKSGSTNPESNPAPPFVFDGFDIQMIDLGLPSGTKWGDRNLGATIEADKGDYISWGEIQPKVDYRYTNYPYYESNSIVEGYHLKPEYDAATQRLGSLCRMPTEEEIEELILNCTATWESATDLNGIQIWGMRYTSKINGNSIFFPCGGLTYYNDIYNYWTHSFTDQGIYWSNTIKSLTDTHSARVLRFSDPSWGVPINEVWPHDRFVGLLVRPVLPQQTT